MWVACSGVECHAVQVPDGGHLQVRWIRAYCLGGAYMKVAMRFVGKAALAQRGLALRCGD